VETSKRRGVIIGLKASKARVSAVGICETKKLEIATADNNHRKRERAEGANKRAVEGWTKDQEMALQRAFFTAKPTPNFWKKVSKLVIFFSFLFCYFLLLLIFFYPFLYCV
jgi:S-adenosylmethionine:diacylglycerol 3-amino-3-carboxypropyl transferase